MTILILMGVSGCGKTTIGQKLACELNWPFYDGDDFHPQFNLEKMSRGIALNDLDRAPWLNNLQQLINRLVHQGKSAIVACSALKNTYRTQLQSNNKVIQFIYLKGSYSLIQARLNARKGHFMPSHLLKSQFDLLEDPTDSIVIDIHDPPHVTRTASVPVPARCLQSI